MGILENVPGVKAVLTELVGMLEKALPQHLNPN